MAQTIRKITQVLGQPLKFSDEKLLGANTDYSGFMRAYRMRFGNAKPGPVLICGAGGVGCAVAFALVELEASEIKLFDIENGTAEKLRRALEAWGYEATTLSRTELIEGMHSSDGLVNCTTLGMHSYPGTAFPIEGFASQRWAFDAVYTPLETQFLNDCRANGLSCLSGFDLWINQGIDAFNIFTNQNMELNRQLLEDVAGWFEEPLTV